MLAKKLLVFSLLVLWSSLAFAQMGGGMNGGMGGGGGGCCGGGSTVIDPPVGSAFKDPVEMADLGVEDPEMGDLDPDPNIFETNLIVRKTPININGTVANLMTFNGHFPGPTIRVKKGDKLVVHYKNDLPPSITSQRNMLGYQRGFTNLHTHGLHVSPAMPEDGTPPGDFVMYKIGPGETFEHIYDTSMQEAGALLFYHPHIHGTSAEQLWAGLSGALVIEDENDLLKGYETHIMILKDISLSGSEPAPHSTMMDYMHGKEGDIIMINGQVNPRLDIKTGQVQRWRILNASNGRFYKLSLDSHSMSLIGTDGGLLDKPYSQSYLLLSPGERVDVLVKGTQNSGNYKFKALPYSRMGMMGGQTITLMTVQYKDKLSPAQSIPSSINPLAMRINPSSVDIAAKRSLYLSMGHGNGYINGQDFDVKPYEIMSQVGTHEIWTIYNQSGMDHPFHQHVNAGQIISVTGGDSGYASLYTKIPAWKDTVLVPRMGSVTILIPIMDFAGMAMFHCHILEHEDIGMMGIWDIMDMGMPMGDEPMKLASAKSKFALFQNFPSPFNPDTWIPYQLGEDTDVKIRIYSAYGQLVKTLDIGHKSAGSYIEKRNSAYWDGKNEAGEDVSSGVYFYNIKAGDFTATKKMVIKK